MGYEHATSVAESGRQHKIDNMRKFGGPEEGFGDSIDQVTCDIGTQRFISGFLLQQELWSHKLHCLLGCG